LSLARQKLSEEASAGHELVEAALEQVQAGLRDLRELAAGIHPSILTHRGLRAALEGLAARSPLVVELGPVVEERLPASVETTAYFVIAEALTNAAKHAQCERAEVRVRREGDWAVVEVRDHGVGGAVATAGSGLRGLADRVSALGGHLEIDSPPGKGTALVARLALAPRDGGHHSRHG
jgi:signal transduction histidine kinase